MKKRLLAIIFVIILSTAVILPAHASMPGPEKINFVVDGGIQRGESPPSYGIVELIFEVSDVTEVTKVDSPSGGDSYQIITAKAPCTVTYIEVKDDLELDNTFEPFLRASQLIFDGSLSDALKDRYSIKKGIEYTLFAGGRLVSTSITLGTGVYELFSGNFGVGTTHYLVVEGDPSASPSDFFTLVTSEDTDIDDNQIKVVFQGDALNFSLPVINKDGRTFYPMRELLEAIGATVGWDSETRTASGTLGDKKAEFAIDSKIYKVNGESFEMDTMAFVESGRTYLPIRFACEGLGFSVRWDDATNSIIIDDSAK
jgi:hypothetical protein